MSRLSQSFLVVMLVAAGSALTACSPEPTPTPTATVTMNSFVGTWRSATTGGEFLEIREGGSFVGFDNCNTVEGSWSPADDGASLEFLGGTQKGCPDGTVWLTRAELATLADSNTLELSTSEGEVVGNLTRQVAE